MAKLIAPAQITKVTELLELLTDPPKYAQYLLNLKQLQDNINEKLGVIDTKELADRMVAGAEEKVAEATLVLDEAKEEAAKIISAAEAEKAAAGEVMRRASAEAERLTSEAKSFQSSVRNREIACEKDRKYLDELAATLADREINVKKREGSINEREAKFAQRVQLLREPV